MKNENLESSVKDKDELIKKQKEEIKTLKEDKKKFKDLAESWKNKFMSVLKFIKDKLFSKKEQRDQYFDFAYELHNKKIIDTEEFDEMYDIYEEIEKYDNNRGKSDDFEL